MSDRKKKLLNLGNDGGKKSKIARKSKIQVGASDFYTVIRNLPAFVKILGYLDMKSKKNLRRVCKELNRLVSELDQSFQMWTVTVGVGKVPTFVIRSEKPVFLIFEDCLFEEFKDPEFYQCWKTYEVEEKLDSVCYLSSISLMIGRLHDRVIGLSVHDSALRKLKHLTADMSQLQVIKIDGDGPDDDDNEEDYESDEEYDDDKADKRYKAILPLICRNAGTLQKLEIKEIELPENSKITCVLPSLKQVTFLNVIGQSFIDSVIQNAPALEKKVIKND